MRHRVYGKHLGRNKNQRNALFKGLVRSLFLYESITTTEVKAKSVKGLVDTLISKGKKGTNSAKEYIGAIIPDATVQKKLLEEIAPRYTDRDSGFATTMRVGRRLGDGAMMVKMSLVKEEAKKEKKATETSEEASEEIKEKKEAAPKTAKVKNKTKEKK